MNRRVSFTPPLWLLCFVNLLALGSAYFPPQTNAQCAEKDNATQSDASRSDAGVTFDLMAGVKITFDGKLLAKHGVLLGDAVSEYDRFIKKDHFTIHELEQLQVSTGEGSVALKELAEIEVHFKPLKTGGQR